MNNLFFTSHHPSGSIFIRLVAILVLSIMVSSSPTAFSQETDPAKSKPKEKDEKQAKLEQAFKDTLTNATFEGRWGLVKDGKLGPAQEEKYTIRGVSKVGNDVWLIHARIQYGQTDATVPIPVRVNWTGDTPLISITDLAIPGVGTYTARVVIHEGMYAGTWSGGDFGGVLNGVIRKQNP